MENLKNKISVIIAAAGNFTRMNGVNKQLYEINGIPVIVRSALIFEEIDEVFEVVISARAEDCEEIESICRKFGVTKLSAVVSGGDSRQKSVFNAFEKCSKDTGFVAIHDGARPLCSANAIKKCIADARIFGGAVLGVPVKDTMKVVEDGLIYDTPDRSKLFAIQTPQIFSKKAYVAGINFALDHDLEFTDDCQLVEAVGIKVCLTKSDYKNLKITTPEDIVIAEAILGLEAKADV